MYSLLPRSDWTDHEGPIWIVVEEDVNIDDIHTNLIIEDIVECMVICLQKRKIQSYMRGRWLGEEHSTCDATMLATCYGLLKPTCKLFFGTERRL